MVLSMSRVRYLDDGSRVRYKTDWEIDPLTKRLGIEVYYKVFQEISEEPKHLWDSETPYDEDYVWETVKREKISKEEYEENV